MKWFKKKQKTVDIKTEPVADNTMFVVCDNGIGLFINRKNHRPFYDSEWEIQISKLEENFTCNIVRFDDETVSNLIKIIQNESYANVTKEFIFGLDQRKSILYD